MRNTAKKVLPVLIFAALFTGGILTLSLTLASCDLIDNIKSSMDSGGNTEDITYIVLFSANGGSGSLPNPKIVTAGYRLPIPTGTGLHRSGYTFGGWNTNSSGSGINYPAGSYLTPTSDITLYAKWNFSEGIIPDGDIDYFTDIGDKVNWLRDNAQRGGNYTIELRGSESTGLLSLSFGSRTNITITIRGVSSNRTIGLSSHGNIFYVGPGVTLVLENITLRGRSSNTFPLVYVDGGTLILRNGTVITNNNSHGVEVDGGSLIMNGGTISGNTVRNTGGGGVIVRDGTFTMNGGIISGNAADWGGGVLVHGGSFTMNGGTITSNIANDYGGGVVVFASAFAKIGGIITGNDATNGNQVVSKQWGGHAVYAYGNSGSPKTRDTTVGPGVGLIYNNNGTFSGEWGN